MITDLRHRMGVLCPICHKNKLRPGPVWRGVQHYHCAGRCGWFAIGADGQLIHTIRPGKRPTAKGITHDHDHDHV